ncbi:MAG: YbaB/EbfC family nucleoid-associated protein [Phycisphaeraceae bacterium]|nr:YbaB/EbfC family nucleoid-associated protein [Phycisphaeraceae bacterium]MCW5763942.1 YbaB/EbfC family nucleoid-associated protein [Phycisphaeraceae bacterium]
MFENFKLMGAVAGFLKNRDQITAAGDRIQKRLDGMRLTGRSEGDLVQVTMTGKMDVESVTISPVLASGMARGEDDRRLGEHLIAEAVNDALKKAQAAAIAVIDDEGDALGLPGLGEQLKQILPR